MRKHASVSLCRSGWMIRLNICHFLVMQGHKDTFTCFQISRSNNKVNYRLYLKCAFTTNQQRKDDF